MTNHTPSYRPDIDGLRAVAIAGVLLFHADPSLLSGGFVGVDVFFVISGFLITSIIHRDLVSGSFSLAKFYERRIRRIFPALATMLIVTLAGGYLLLLPDDFSSLAESMIHAVASISNIHFLDIKTDYYNNEASPIPLIHTWSLGVEEQFYLIFPLLCLGLHKFLKSTRGLIIAVSILFVVSLAASAHYVEHRPMKAFFLLPFRSWELMLGALLALVRPRLMNSRAASTLGVAGLSLIITSMVAFSKETAFPGWAALMPCSGAALLIFTGQTSGSWVARLLSWKPLVGAGLISYSVYLWHWPLIIFTENLLPDDTSRFFYIIIGSIFLGAISWWIVEQPFRRSGFMLRKQVFMAWALASLALVVVGWTIKSNGGFPQRFTEDVRAILDYKNLKRPAPGKIKVGFDFHAIPLSGDLSKDPTIALWGDSFASALLPLIATLAEENGKCVRSFGRGGVAPIVGLVPSAKRSDREKILDYTQRILDHITADPLLKTVILEARWDLYSTAKTDAQGWFTRSLGYYSKPVIDQGEFFAARLNHTVENLLAAGKTVVIVYPIPAPQCSVPDYLARLRLSGKLLPTTFKCRDLQEQSVVTSILDSLPASDKLIRVHPSRKMLVNGEAVIMAEGKPLYYDAYHLSPPGALYLRDLFEPLFPGF